MDNQTRGGRHAVGAVLLLSALCGCASGGNGGEDQTVRMEMRMDAGPLVRCWKRIRRERGHLGWPGTVQAG